VIGGEAKGLGGAPSGMAGLVTSRFRVCTDLIELATTFLTFVSLCEVLYVKVVRRAERIEKSYRASIEAIWFVLSTL
jgi:hypothetical protein